MQQASESIFQAGAQSGAQLDIELVSSNARIGGSINLGAYSRLSDLLNFHDEILTIAAGAVMGPTGERSGGAGLPLDVRLSELTIVLDRSDYVPPADSEQMIEKREHKMLAVTDAQAQKLFWIFTNGDWSLSLRPTTDAADSPEGFEWFYKYSIPNYCLHIFGEIHLCLRI